jgi:hypothetical protein
MQAGVRFGPQVAQSLDIVDVGKRLQVFQSDLLQFIDGLLAEGVTVDEEQNAAEAFGFDQAVGQSNARYSFPSPSGHGHQQLTLALRKATFDGTDSLFLIVAQGQVIGRFGCESGIGSNTVLLQEL